MNHGRFFSGASRYKSASFCRVFFFSPPPPPPPWPGHRPHATNTQLFCIGLVGYCRGGDGNQRACSEKKFSFGTGKGKFAFAQYRSINNEDRLSGRYFGRLSNLTGARTKACGFIAGRARKRNSAGHDSSLIFRRCPFPAGIFFYPSDQTE